MMKALSIQQPWAYLIVHGYKGPENRTWWTSFRGRLLVHASKKIDHEGIEWLRRTHPEIPLPDKFDTGGIVGAATLTDCVTTSDDPLFFGPYGFVMADPEPLSFRPLRGHLGFFDVPDLTAPVEGAKE